MVDAPPPGTRAVLNLCELEDAYTVEAYRWEPIRDAEPAPSLDWLRRQVDFLREQHDAGNTVYVHCRNGVSRSAMVVVAYLMHIKGWSRDEALRFVQARRPVARPHPAFMRLLLEWEQQITGNARWDRHGWG
jgi:protein-tyrosine phosphatase